MIISFLFDFLLIIFRTLKSAVQKKTESNDSSEEQTNSSSDNLSIDEKMNKEKLIDQFKENFDTNEQKATPDDKMNERPSTSSVKKEIVKKTSNFSRTQSAEEDNLDGSSDEESPMKKLEKSKSTLNLSDFKNEKKRSITNLENNISTVTIVDNTIKDLNPLKSLLNNSELLQFVVNPVPRNKVYQCTIIRDKKGLDRSLYPTYYMHLQTINSRDDNQQLKIEDFKDTSTKKDDTNDETSNSIANSGIANGKHSNNYEPNDTHNRQVFLLSGRRRKKSKTYLISCNPFEITRLNAIAKLKSNVIGTQFNTIRIVQNNRRLDYATIIYVSIFHKNHYTSNFGLERFSNE